MAHSLPEFRQDLVSGDWILISVGRRKRPFLVKPAKQSRLSSVKKDCPLENPQKSGNGFPVLWYPHPDTPLGERENLSSWFVQVFPNKYPSLVSRRLCPREVKTGPYKVMEGVGLNELIATRDHERTIVEMTDEEVVLVLRAYQERYKTLKNEPCLEYTLVFHNQGELAGASLYHPHSQLIALPIIPPDVKKSLSGSAEFFKKHKKCVHCLMLDWETKEKTRIIYRNGGFAVLSPFASRVSYETRIFPISHASDFSAISQKDLVFFADALKQALLRIKRVLNGPDYNFFIHTAPAKTKNNGSYHWHLEILPRTSKWAGVELGTGIEIVAVSPEEAALNLRKAG